MITVRCAWCGKEIRTFPCKIKKHNFCSRRCLAEFSNKSKNPEGYRNLKNYAGMSRHMSELNRVLNPGRMNFATRAKLSAARRGNGSGKTYTKSFGVHTHRVVAARMLGRQLLPGEVVHHIDGNKRNNRPDNLMVLRIRRLMRNGTRSIKGVMPHDIQTTCIPAALHQPDP